MPLTEAMPRGQRSPLFACQSLHFQNMYFGLLFADLLEVLVNIVWRTSENGTGRSVHSPVLVNSFLPLCLNRRRHAWVDHDNIASLCPFRYSQLREMFSDKESTLCTHVLDFLRTCSPTFRHLVWVCDLTPQ